MQITGTDGVEEIVPMPEYAHNCESENSQEAW